jgi:hypothetical protein
MNEHIKCMEANVKNSKANDQNRWDKMMPPQYFLQNV